MTQILLHSVIKIEISIKKIVYTAHNNKSRIWTMNKL